jgi:hypothetical protein
MGAVIDNVEVDIDVSPVVIFSLVIGSLVVSEIYCNNFLSIISLIKNLPNVVSIAIETEKNIFILN